MMAAEDMTRGFAHAPVLLAEALDFLRPRAGGRYLDGTLGLGGHSGAIMEATDGEARLLGMDRDENALARAAERLAGYGDRVALRQGDFASFEVFLDELGWDGLDGALLDLGVSSMQLDDPGRGFSFLAEGPLDMRMGAASGLEPASVVVNTASLERLKEIIRRFGEDPQAGRIARAIVTAREQEPIETTSQLAAIVERAYPAKWRRTARMHPATRTFQAIRMWVNRESEQLESFLARVVERLHIGGRVVIISFHSLEDRVVKHTFREEARECVCPPRQPLCTCDKQSRLKVLTKKPVTPSEEECRENPRSRSAKLRAAERISGDAT